MVAKTTLDGVPTNRAESVRSTIDMSVHETLVDLTYNLEFSPDECRKIRGALAVYEQVIGSGEIVNGLQQSVGSTMILDFGQLVMLIDALRIVRQVDDQLSLGYWKDGRNK